MISYAPLKQTLGRANRKLNELEIGNGGVLNKRTVSKLRHNRSVNLETIERVCLFLDVPVEEVVVITKE